MKLVSGLFVMLMLAGTARADDAERFLAWIDQLANTVVADGHACHKITADMNASIDSHKDMLEIARKAKAEGKKLSPEQTKRVQGSFMRMIQSMGDCIRDKDVQAAFHRMDFGPPEHH